jgi:hypothetical protein
MGKNLPAKKYKIGQRTERFLHYELDHTGNGYDSHFLDLAAGLSAVNKRAYRQGLYYYIKSISIVEITGDTKIQFGTAPDTWQIPLAWKMGFRAWSRMNSEAAANIPGGDLKIAGKYHDFKVYLNNNHRTDPDVTVPSNGPVSMDGSPQYNPTDWDYSVLHTQDPDGNNAPNDDFTMMLLGSHQGSDNAWDSLGLTTSYARSRNLNDQSGTPIQLSNLDTDPLLNLFDISDTHDDVLDDLQTTNDNPPYDDDSAYMDTVVRAQAAINSATGAAMLPGFCVPLGLLEVLTFCPGGDNTVKVLIELAPGPYHGVYAERIS